MDAARPGSSAAARPPDRPSQPAGAASDEAAAQGLLSVSPDNDDDDLVRVEHPPPPSPSTASSAGRAARGSLPPIRIPPPEQRQSALARSRPAGAPRTPNRVRFDIDDEEAMLQALDENGQPIWVDEEDYFEGHEEEDGAGEDEPEPAAGEGLRVPLLTDIEAPSVTLALEFDPEDHLESAKPRSNLRNAFMNMANSIM